MLHKLDKLLKKMFSIQGTSALKIQVMDSHLLPEFIVPTAPNNYYHTFQSYVCMLNIQKIGLKNIELAGEFRNNLLAELEKVGIATRQGTHAVHLLDYYKNYYGYNKMDYPNAYACDRLSITLPLYVQMTSEDQEYVIGRIRYLLDNRES